LKTLKNTRYSAVDIKNRDLLIDKINSLSYNNSMKKIKNKIKKQDKKEQEVNLKTVVYEPYLTNNDYVERPYKYKRNSSLNVTKMMVKKPKQGSGFLPSIRFNYSLEDGKFLIAEPRKNNSSVNSFKSI